MIIDLFCFRLHYKRQKFPTNMPQSVPSPRDRGNCGSEHPLLFQSLEMEQNTSSVTSQREACSPDDYSALLMGPNSTLAGKTGSSDTHKHTSRDCFERKNDIKKVDESPPSDPYRHLVLPSDTLAGLCLTYKVSKQALQRANPGCCVSSDGLRLTVQPGDHLVIPFKRKSCHVRQDVHSHEYKLASVLGQSRHLTTGQAERYVPYHFLHFTESLQWTTHRIMDLAARPLSVTTTDT